MKAGNVKILNLIKKRRIMEFKKASSMFNISNIIGFEAEHEKKNKICFREDIFISKLDDTNNIEAPLPVGGLCLDVQKALDDKYTVYVSSKFIYGNSTGYSKITSWLNKDLHTIEENRTEYTTGENNQKQIFYAAIQERGLYVKNTFKLALDPKTKVTMRTFPIDSITKLVCEGSNFLLMRLLAICSFVGKFEMSTLYINGDLCRNIYVCEEPKSAMVNNVKIGVCRILRTIIEENGIVHECSTTLTTNGNIVKQEWRNCAYILQMNPLKNPTEFTACGCDGLMPKKPYWQNDMQLMSLYLEQRELCKHHIMNYVDRTPELSDLLADYVKNILQHKPLHLLDYTAEFFHRYASYFE